MTKHERTILKAVGVSDFYISLFENSYYWHLSIEENLKQSEISFNEHGFWLKLSKEQLKNFGELELLHYLCHALRGDLFNPHAKEHCDLWKLACDIVIYNSLDVTSPFTCETGKEVILPTYNEIEKYFLNFPHPTLGAEPIYLYLKEKVKSIYNEINSFLDKLKENNIEICGCCFNPNLNFSKSESMNFIMDVFTKAISELNTHSLKHNYNKLIGGLAASSNYHKTTSYSSINFVPEEVPVIVRAFKLASEITTSSGQSILSWSKGYFIPLSQYYSVSPRYNSNIIVVMDTSGSVWSQLNRISSGVQWLANCGYKPKVYVFADDCHEWDIFSGKRPDVGSGTVLNSVKKAVKQNPDATVLCITDGYFADWKPGDKPLWCNTTVWAILDGGQEPSGWPIILTENTKV
ncbi:MAG: hypothetical protein QXH92_03780 [Candidatus Aenigmatarchaeota archaeon]